MPKRRSDAHGRKFLDQFERVRVSRFRAMGVVDPSRNYALIPHGDRTKLLNVAHTHLEDAPRCIKCCNAMNIWQRSSMGWGMTERLRACD